jgi:hypothetical protein
MRASRPVVHPVEAPPPAALAVAAAAVAVEAGVGAGGGAAAHGGENAQPRGVRMKDPPGAPGTPGGLGLRLVQAFFAAAALAVMASTDDFPSVSAFWCARSSFLGFCLPPFVWSPSPTKSLPF